MKIRFVCASRVSEAEFFTGTALGRSLALYHAYRPDFEIRVFGDNAKGLPTVYNQAITEAAGVSRILAFAHDDLHLTDLYWPERMAAALEQFDIAGLAGNVERAPKQPSWAFVIEDGKIVWDRREHLSGAVAHGPGFPPLQVDVFGPARRAVKLLDGLLLLVRSDTLHAHDLRFDPLFNFHFYDLDFCRQAELKGLRMGTWDISVAHESDGSFGGGAWRDEYLKYVGKWRS